MQRKTTRITAQEALKQYLAEKAAQGLSRATLEGYNKELLVFISPIQFVSQITPDYMWTTVSELSDRMKPVSVNHYLRVYRAFAYWCMEHEYLKDFKIKLMKEQEAPIRIYSQEDLIKLLEKPTHSDSFGTWRTWAMISFVMGTGARIGTLIDIKKEDIDLNNKEVVYRHSKNKRAPIIPLCDSLIKNLTYYMNEFELGEYLFSSDENTKLTVNANRMAFERYCRAKGVEYNSFHALRHTYAKQFIVNGGNPFQLQKMLDHQTLAMSQHYTHLFGTDLHGAVNDFSPLAKMSTAINIKVKRKK